MSTIKVNSIKNTSTDNGGIVIDGSGHVTVDGVQLPTAGSSGNKNLVINGSFQVDQRASQGAGATFMADRFISDPDGGTATSSRGTLTTGSPYDEGFRYFGRVTNTAVITDTAAHYRFVNYKGFEAQNIAQSGWKYTDATSFVTLSFWVRSSVGGAFYGYLNAIDGTNSSFAFLIAGDGDSSLVADAWTKVTVTVPGHANLSFDLNANNGLNLYLSPFLGTNRTASSVTAGAWQNFDGAARTPDAAGGQTWATTAGATWDITGLQLELGSKATPFAHESYGQTLAKCQRYFYSAYNAAVDGTNDSPLCMGVYYDTDRFFGVISFPTTMRIAPTLDASSGSIGEFAIFRDNTANNLSTITAGDAGPNYAEVQAQSAQNAVGTKNLTGFLRAVGNTARIFFEAEL